MPHPDDYDYHEYEDCGCVKCWHCQPERDKEETMDTEPDHLFFCRRCAGIQKGDMEHDNAID